MHSGPRTAWIDEPERRTPISQDVDVLVVGAGSAGVAAAVAAAESGAKTMLVDAGGVVGGTLTEQLLEHTAGFLGGDGEPIVGGIGQRLIDLLASFGGSPGHQPDHSRYQGGRTPINHGEMSLAEALLLETTGVTLLLDTRAVQAVMSDSRLEAVIFEGKSGRHAVRAQVVVDCSGDADVAALAGSRFQPDPKPAVQPASLLFKLGGLKFDELLAYVASHPVDFRPGSIPPAMSDPYVTLWGFGELIARAHQAGTLSLLRTEIHFGGWPARGEAVINVTRTPSDGLRGDFTGKVLPILSRQVLEFARFFREFVPGGSESYVSGVATRVGVRESRRILGLYTLTRADVVAGTRFEDGVAQCAHPIDIHDPVGAGLSHQEQIAATFDIPYRSLVPISPTNLLAAGRNVSSTHEAHGALRTTAQCFAMGEAAGTAAALCVRRACDPADLAPKDLRAALIERGALLGPNPTTARLSNSVGAGG